MKLSELVEALRIDKFNLDQETAQQPELLWRAAEAAALARSKLDQAKFDLEQVEAELDKMLREKHEEENEKYSEKSIAMELSRHPRRANVYKNYLDCKLRAERYDNIRDSFKSRGYAIRDLVAQQISGYFSDSSGRADVVSKALEARANYNLERLKEKKRLRRV